MRADALHFNRQRAAACQTQCRLKRLGQTLLPVGPNGQTVNDPLNRVLSVLFERRHCACICAKKSACPPLRFTITGAAIINLVSAGNANTASTICETLCAHSGASCSGQ